MLTEINEKEKQGSVLLVAAGWLPLVSNGDHCNNISLKERHVIEMVQTSHVIPIY